jgi:hypothetical protein
MDLREICLKLWTGFTCLKIGTGTKKYLSQKLNVYYCRAEVGPVKLNEIA